MYWTKFPCIVIGKVFMYNFKILIKLDYLSDERHSVILRSFRVCTFQPRFLLGYCLVFKFLKFCLVGIYSSQIIMSGEKLYSTIQWEKLFS